MPLNARDVERLREQGWQERPEYRGVSVTAAHEGGGRQLAKRSDGSCVFLDDDGLCRIHKELGFEAKPLICRMFPLQLVPHEREAVLTLRRACPSAAADKGREVAEQIADAKAYAKEGELVEEGTSAPPIKAGEPAEWRRSRVVLEALRRLTGDGRYPPIRRLVHGLELCRLLEQAQTRDFELPRYKELVELLEQQAPEESAEHFSERRDPGRSARVLFRQVVLETVRLHPRCYQAPTWGTRLKMVGWAFRMVAGRGKLPRVHSEFPDATFEQLEQPLGALTAPLIGPLARYFETTAASYQYCLAQRRGWTVLESYRQLALLYPLGLWLLRWASAGRTPTEDDLFEIIATLDRTQGYAPLSGARQRSRLRTLQSLGALPALIAWYGR